MGTDKKLQFGPKLRVRIILSLAVLGVGLLFMFYFSSLKTKPHKGNPKEAVLRVDVHKAVPVDVQTRLKGFGVAEPVTIVRISAEVGGRIVYTHPSFKKGKTIAKDEVIFRIDPLNYQASLNNLKAGLAQKEAGLSRVQKEFGADKNRLSTLERTMALARDEYDRLRVLLEKNRIGNRSAVDQAEKSMNTAIDTVDQMKRSLSLYPIEVQEAKAGIASVRADLDKAAADLARCTVRAPFTCRVKSAAMEAGEYVSPGQEVVILADDSQLEILVSMDAREVSSWLSFEVQATENPSFSGGWFPKPDPVACEISWIEAKNHVWKGTLSRLVEFDQSSRTMTLAVGFDPSKNNCPGCPPLVEGMFCSVTIPGKTIEGVFRLKRWLVTTDNTIYVADEGRLKTRQVNRVYADGDDLFVTGDIHTGDKIITTRLVDPLENSALKLMNRNPPLLENNGKGKPKP